MSEHRPIPGQPSSPAMHAELEKLRGRAKVMPNVMSRLGSLALGFGAFDLGFSVGTGLNQRFFRLGLGDPGPPPWVPGDAPGWSDDQVWKAYQKGETLQAYYTSKAAWEDVLLIEDTVRSATEKRAQLYTRSGGYTCDYYPRFGSLKFFTGEQVEVLNEFSGGQCISNQQTQAREDIFRVWQYVPSTRLTRTPPKKGYDAQTDGSLDVAIPSWSGAPISWDDLLAAVSSELSLHADEYQHLTEWMEIVEEQAPGTFDMPDCRGMTVQQCVVELEKAGFVGKRHTVTLDSDGAWVTQPARSIVKTSPGPGQRVDQDGEIWITRNPSPDQMPVIVPAIVPGQKRDEVERKLRELDLTPVWEVASPAVPEFGPSEVTLTPAESGMVVSRLTEITITVNPPDAEPVPGSGTSTTGTGEPPDPPDEGIDWEPLKGVPAAFCGSFPFGAPCWLVDAVSAWSSTSEAPVFSISLPNPLPGGDTMDFEFDMAIVDPAMQIIRPVLVIISTIGIVLWWSSLAMFGGKTVTRDKGGEGDE